MASDTPLLTPYLIFQQDLNGHTFQARVNADDTVSYLIDDVDTGLTLNGFLAAAAGEVGGAVVRNGTISESGLEHFGAATNPFVSQNDAADDVSIGGAGVGGSFTVDFSNDVAADAFEAFAKDLLGSDPPLTKRYEFSGSTNGGANRIQIFEDEELTDLNGQKVENGFVFRWSGADTAGTASTDNWDNFVEEMGKLFGGTRLVDGTLNGVSNDLFSQTQARIATSDATVMEISGRGIGGSERYDFATANEAQVFLTFFKGIVDEL